MLTDILLTIPDMMIHCIHPNKQFIYV